MGSHVHGPVHMCECIQRNNCVCIMYACIIVMCEESGICFSYLIYSR